MNVEIPAYYRGNDTKIQTFEEIHLEQFRKKRINLGELDALKKRLREKGLNTVCESARCPNIGECFCGGTATFLIAGTTCTRGCRFCAIGKGKPIPLDPDEPRHVAEMIRELGIRHAVITSVTRDDLPDGGAAHYARTIEDVRSLAPGVGIEVLVPDFGGDLSAAANVFSARPDIFAHNLETVPSLYSVARAGADYHRSLRLLQAAGAAGLTTKAGIMVGLGETANEVLSVMDDLRASGCDLLTIGQYLAPSKAHLPVKEYVPLESFEEYRKEALARRFSHCESGPYVRSSYMAHTYAPKREKQ